MTKSLGVLFLVWAASLSAVKANAADTCQEGKRYVSDVNGNAAYTDSEGYVYSGRLSYGASVLQVSDVVSYWQGHTSIELIQVYVLQDDDYGSGQVGKTVWIEADQTKCSIPGQPSPNPNCLLSVTDVYGSAAYTDNEGYGYAGRLSQGACLTLVSNEITSWHGIPSLPLINVYIVSDPVDSTLAGQTVWVGSVDTSYP